MEEVELKIELLARSIVSNFTARLLGPLKEAKPQEKKIILLCLDGESSLTWVPLSRRQTVMINSLC